MGRDSKTVHLEQGLPFAGEQIVFQLLKTLGWRANTSNQADGAAKRIACRQSMASGWMPSSSKCPDLQPAPTSFSKGFGGGVTNRLWIRRDIEHNGKVGCQFDHTGGDHRPMPNCWSKKRRMPCVSRRVPGTMTPLSPAFGDQSEETGKILLVGVVSTRSKPVAGVDNQQQLVLYQWCCLESLFSLASSGRAIVLHLLGWRPVFAMQLRR